MLIQKNGVDWVLCYEVTSDASYYEDDEYGESYLVRDTETNGYGRSLMPKDYFNDKVVVDGCKLTIGNKTVVDYENQCIKVPELTGKIPALYVIRTWNGKYMEFECGFDLLNDGRFWAKENYFYTIEDCFSWLQNKFGDFHIFLEEPMRL